MNLYIIFYTFIFINKRKYTTTKNEVRNLKNNKNNQNNFLIIFNFYISLLLTLNIIFHKKLNFIYFNFY